jgi:hypothetical protein
MEQIKANAILEIVGSPKEHVEETMEKVISMIKENKDFEIIKKEISEPNEREFPNPSKEGEKLQIWSTLAELEVDFKDFYALTTFCFDFMPSSIEVLDPADLKIGALDTTNALNDLLARLHQQARVMLEYSALKKRLAKSNPDN